MLSSDSIAEYLKGLHDNRTGGIAAYWVEAYDSRTELVSRISALTSDLPMLTVTAPGGAFDDPDGILDDLSRTIVAHKSWFTPERRTSIIRDQKFSLVLVSKRSLRIPQLSSPVSLPEWFPLWSGQLLTVHIRSISEAVEISLAAREVPVEPLNGALFAVEAALSLRLGEVVSRSSHGANLARRVGGRSGPASLSALATQSTIARGALSPSDFRPGGASLSPYVVSQLFRLWWECSHSGLHDLAVDLAEALDISSNSEINQQYSFASLLTRTNKPPLSQTPPGVTFSRNLLVSVAHAIQFTNAAHHAGDYPNYPALLVISYVRDLVSSCQNAADTITKLSTTGGA